MGLLIAAILIAFMVYSCVYAAGKAEKQMEKIRSEMDDFGSNEKLEKSI